ncbi:MAG: hypothetical protein LBQ68_00810 [Clostridiales bacterium]|jgi:DNA anti-recombination protein RmuC|nr:hypothetical protein [Clostridiales bacterium]
MINNILNQVSVQLSNPTNARIALYMFLGLFLLTILLRIIVCAGYQTHYAIFNLNAKPITDKTGLEKIRFGILKNIIADYVRTAEKNTSGVHLSAIVRKYILRITFLGWSYTSISRFVTGFELATPFIGLALSLLYSNHDSNNQLMFGLGAVCSFVSLRLFASLFDFEYARDKLEAELIEFVEREVGQFYAGDFATILLRLKHDISVALRDQATSLSTVITNLEKKLSIAIGDAVTNSFAKIQSLGSSLDKPIAALATTIDKTAEQINKNNESISRFEDITVQLSSVSDNFATNLNTHVTSLSEQFNTIARQIEKLAAASADIQESNENVKKLVSVLQDQSQYIEKNQTALKDALTNYEASLESITQKMGDGFGSIVDYHMSGTYQTLNSGLQGNINKILSSNQELISRLQALFEQLEEQSRSETSAIVNMNDQMNLRFEALDSKIL